MSKVTDMNMSNVEFRILDYLNQAESPSYAHEMVEKSQGALKRGTAYTTLQRMERKGLVASEKEIEADIEHNLPRRLYQITDDGRARLSEMKNDMVNLLGIHLDSDKRQVLKSLFNDGSVEKNVNKGALLNISESYPEP